jgi:hypothetical protein
MKRSRDAVGEIATAECAGRTIRRKNQEFRTRPRAVSAGLRTSISSQPRLWPLRSREEAL